MPKKKKIKSIKIGVHEYEVVYTEHLNGEVGHIDNEQLKIAILDGLANSVEEQTLMHEVYHGIKYNLGYLDHNEEEVDGVAHGFLQFIKDNKDLIKKLLK